MIDKINEALKGYVFFEEAVELLQKKYTKGSAKVKLSDLSLKGRIETLQLYKGPKLYKKSDILTMVNE